MATEYPILGSIVMVGWGLALATLSGLALGSPRHAFKLGHWFTVRSFELTWWGKMESKLSGVIGIAVALLFVWAAVEDFLNPAAGMAAGIIVGVVGVGTAHYVRERWTDEVSLRTEFRAWRRRSW